MQSMKPKLGVTHHLNVTTFRLWAPFADSVSIIGDFENWSENGIPLKKEAHGNWSIALDNVKVGHQYKYLITHGKLKLSRNDPRALQLTSAQDASIVTDPEFDWQGDNYQLPPKNLQVIYELHIGTFNSADTATPGTFQSAIEKLDHLQDLGINVIELMPINCTNMERWWGYEPTYLYAVESAYGGRRAFKEFVREAHKRNIGVILDVVYNHLSPEPGFDLWKFDGWSKPGKGGIYFYSDERIETPWGPRPDYGRPEVRDYIIDNVTTWINDCHLDGIRVDAVFAIRNSKGYNDDPDHDIPEGWQLIQDINKAIKSIKPNAISIAEDVACNSSITLRTSKGGAGFDAQWETTFPSILRNLMSPVDDKDRDLNPLLTAMSKSYNEDSFARVIYSESHDADANGNTRLNESIAPTDSDNIFARKRSMLAATIALTTPGIPMIFQGQEFMEAGWFSHWDNLDWQKAEEFKNITNFYRDIINLRRNHNGKSTGLSGGILNIIKHDSDNKVLAYERKSTEASQPGNSVIVVMNLSNTLIEGYSLELPTSGTYEILLNSDWRGYSTDFSDQIANNLVVVDEPTAQINLAPYSVNIYSLM